MEETSPSQQIYSPAQVRPKKSSKKFLLFFIVAILIAIIGAVIFFTTRSEEKQDKKATTPTPTEFEFPTDTPAPIESPTQEVSPTQKPSNTPTPRPTSNPIDPTTGLDRSKITIEVLNGSGIAGAGKKAADILTSLGYKVSATGNADNYDFEKTVISVKSTNSKYLDLIKKDLGTSYSIGSTSASFTGSTDAQVIVGKQ